MAALEPGTKKCPFCAEIIKAEAVVCRYCGRDLIPEPMRHMTAPVTSAEPPAQPTPEKKRKGGGCLGVVVALFAVVALFVIVTAFSNNSASTPTRRVVSTPRASPTPTFTVAELKARSKLIEFDALARDTESWTGKLVQFRGEVIQVAEVGTSGAVLRVNVTQDGSFWNDTVWVVYPGYGPGQRVLEDDIVEFVAHVDGRHTYETVIGAHVTLPALTALWLEVE